MASDTQQVLELAEKLGKLIAEHPAVEKYRQAQKSLSEDPDAARLMNEFDQQLMMLAQQEQSGQPITETQRHKLESIQTVLASNLRVKALSIAQYDLSDLLRKVSQAWQRPVAEAQGQPRPPSTVATAGPRLVTPGL